MAVRKLLVVVALVGCCYGALLTDEQYYKMPRLFHLDDFNRCLSKKTGLYCLGSFELSPTAGDELFRMMQEYSSDPFHFNHTRLHRGYCVSSRCPNSAPPAERFANCVDSRMRARYGLQASLLSLDYCRSGGNKRPGPDYLDIAVAIIIACVVLLNVAATVYHSWWAADSKQNEYIVAWSLKTSWARLTASYDDGDKRLLALNPIQGIRSVFIFFIIFAHCVGAYLVGYIYNPLYIEQHGRNPLAFFAYNGTAFVHVFLMLSSFLLAYNLLLSVDNNPKRQLSLSMLPWCIIHRLTRLIPLYLLSIGLASTWWAHAGDGAMWNPVMEAEVLRCRSKWWTHLLFVNNIVEPEKICNLPTWFLAVDMQLYILGTILTLLIGRWPRAALKIVGFLFISSVIGLFFYCYTYDLKSALFYANPENTRVQQSSVPSFILLHISPWGGLPASLLGLFLAFLHYNLEKKGVQVREYKLMRIAYYLSIPLLLTWVLAGCWFKNLSSPLAISIVTALDRPIIGLLLTVVLLAIFNKIGNLWKLLSWRGFHILARMSLSFLLFHLTFAFAIVGGRPLPSEISLSTGIGYYILTISFTFLISLLTTLFVEMPMQNFSKIFFRGLQERRDAVNYVNDEKKTT